MFHLYMICNPITNSYYVGISKNGNKRWKQHITTSRTIAKFNRKCNQPIIHALIKYGVENFSFKIIEEVCTWEEACLKEIATIKFMKEIGQTLYNATEGGEGHSLSDEMKAKIYTPEYKAILSKHWSGPLNPSVKNPRYGKNNSFFGKTISDDVRKKLHHGKKRIFTNEQVIEMRKLSSEDKLTISEISEIFQAKEATIYDIVTHRTCLIDVNINFYHYKDLTTEQIIFLRTKYANRENNTSELAKEYKITIQQTLDIVSGRKFPEIGGPLTIGQLKKISNEQVKEMRDLWKTGNYNKSQIARKFNVDISHAIKIINNKTRKNG